MSTGWWWRDSAVLFIVTPAVQIAVFIASARVRLPVPVVDYSGSSALLFRPSSWSWGRLFGYGGALLLLAVAPPVETTVSVSKILVSISE